MNTLNTFKGEVKKELITLIKSEIDRERERIKTLIIQEMLECHKEGTPTSRLTSLFNKL